ncbi:hypothetical protein FRC07_011504 [Ceratobasidium sp. 392]|nr:hypothetical protein FRC07_011504 [Ceratobasidium sp. 392]
MFQFKPKYGQVPADEQELANKPSERQRAWLDPPPRSHSPVGSPAAPTNISRPSEPSQTASGGAGVLASTVPHPGRPTPGFGPFIPPPPPPGLTPIPPSPFIIPPTPSTVLSMPSPFSKSSHTMDPYGHIRDSTSAIWSESEKWDEFIHPNGSLYWTCSAYPAQVVSDIKPPLSNLHTSAPSTISRIMHALGEIPQIKDYHNWEIYTDGSSCVYIDHGSRAASEAFESLEDFRDRVEKLRGQMNIKYKLRFESAYWTFMQSHPNHRDLPDGAIDDATEAVVWCHAGKLFSADTLHYTQELHYATLPDRALFKSSNAPFSQDDAREMTELMKTIADLKRPTLKTWYCASILRAICKDRLASHYGQNDAREVRRRERTEDVESSLPFNSIRDKITWHLVAFMSLGAPLRYIKRIHNVATVLVSGTVALLAIPALNGMARIAGLVSALYALSSVLCGMLLISNHQDRVESFGGTGVTYFERAKSRTTGTTRPLAVILSLPLAFMLWGMFWFVLAVMSCAYGPGPEEVSHRYTVAARYISFVFFGVLAITGFAVLSFFHQIWEASTPTKPQTQAHTHGAATAVDMVIGQGGNPLMQFSGDQRLEFPPTPGVGYAPGPSMASYAYPLQVGQIPSYSAEQPAFVPQQQESRMTSETVANIARPPTFGSHPLPTGPVSTTNHPFSYSASPMAAIVSSRPTESAQISLPGYSTRKEMYTVVLEVSDSNAWLSYLQDQETYDKMTTDVRQECGKHGSVYRLLIPQSPQDNNHVIVTYESKIAANNASVVLKRNGVHGHRVQRADVFVTASS